MKDDRGNGFVTTPGLLLRDLAARQSAVADNVHRWSLKKRKLTAINEAQVKITCKRITKKLYKFFKFYITWKKSNIKLHGTHS